MSQVQCANIASDPAHVCFQVREIEHADFTALNQDYGESIDALTRAIAVLKKQNYDRKQAATELMQVQQKYAVDMPPPLS